MGHGVVRWRVTRSIGSHPDTMEDEKEKMNLYDYTIHIWMGVTRMHMAWVGTEVVG
jgi:hypothetical protein